MTGLVWMEAWKMQGEVFIWNHGKWKSTLLVSYIRSALTLTLTLTSDADALAVDGRRHRFFGVDVPLTVSGIYRAARCSDLCQKYSDFFPLFLMTHVRGVNPNPSHWMTTSRRVLTLKNKDNHHLLLNAQQTTAISTATYLGASHDRRDPARGQPNVSAD